VAEDDDDLDLGIDLLDDDNSEADLSDEELPQIDDLLDLSDEDFDLATGDMAEPDDQLTFGDETVDADTEDDLELVDLHDSIGQSDGAMGLDDLDLDDLADSADVADPASDGLSLDLDFDDAGEGDGGIDDLDTDEIDLSDIEEMLSDDDVEPGADSADAPEIGADGGDMGDLDLSDFVRDSAQDATPEEAAAAVGNDIDMDLDLELDLDDEVIPVSAAPAAEEPHDELDFTDLADMLEPDEKAASPTEAAADEADLEFDLEAVDDGPTDVAPEERDLDLDSLMDGDGAEEELDLTLELDGLSDDEPATADSQPELEFDLEADLGDPGTGLDHEDELELNLLEDEELAFGAAGDETQAIATDAAGITGGLAAGAQEIGATTDDFATEEFTDARDLTADTDFMNGDDADMPPLAAKPKRRGKTLAAVVVGLVLILAALIVPNLLGIRIPVLSDVRIPFLSDWIGGSDKSDPGNLKITPLGKTIDAKYVENQTAGKLLVISGQVRNDYKHPRSHIQIAGKLFNKDGSVAQSATVYAGNMIPTLDLARLDLTKIKDLLQNQSGQRKSNLNVKNSRVVPFMIVFDQLPDGLDEYTVEVVGSTR